MTALVIAHAQCASIGVRISEDVLTLHDDTKSSMLHLRQHHNCELGFTCTLWTHGSIVHNYVGWPENKIAASINVLAFTQ